MKCFDVEEIPVVEALPDDDERKRHLKSCPRCSSLALLYERFMAGKRVAGADPDQAEGVLAETVRRALAGQKDLLEKQKPEGPGGRFRFPGWLRPVRARLALAGALVLAAVVVAALIFYPPSSPQGPGLLRGGGSPQGAPRLEVYAVEEGGVVLRWRAMPGADSYLVEARDASLRVLGRFGPVTGTSLSLSPEELLGGEYGELYWQLIVLGQGDTLSRSRPEPLRMQAR